MIFVVSLAIRWDGVQTRTDVPYYIYQHVIFQTLEMLDTNSVIAYTYAQNALFALLTVLYSIAVYAIDTKSKRALRVRQIALDGLFVSGLTSLTYFWIASGGNREIRWLVYSICSTVLLTSVHTMTTRRARENEDMTALRAAQALTVVVVASGYFFSNTAASVTAKWVAYGVTSLWFLAIPVLLVKAISLRSRGPMSTPLIAAIATGALGWLGYPLVFALGPVMSNTIDETAELLGYNIADILSKILFHGALFAIAHYHVGTKRGYKHYG